MSLRDFDCNNTEEVGLYLRRASEAREERLRRERRMLFATAVSVLIGLLVWGAIFRLVLR